MLTLRPALARIRQLLSEQPRTALEISIITKCSKPTAYAQLQQMKKQGVKLTKTKIRQGASGPAATAYAIADS